MNLTSFSAKLFFLATALLLVISCKKDDDNIGNDQTKQVAGTYIGIYAESDGSFSFDFDDVQANVKKESNSKIEVNIKVIPGLTSVVFTADMTDETHFKVPQFPINEEDFEGTGSLNGTTLSIDLEKVSEPAVILTYEGTKQ